MKIYLAGSVPKGDKEAETFKNWRDDYKDILENFFEESSFVEPYHRDLDESDFLSVVGHDCRHIKESQLIVVNTENKLGVGTSQEIVIAKYFQKPVISVLPKNTPHRKIDAVFHGKLVEDWIHPFIFVFSDFIVENVEGIGKIKDEIFKSKIKDISIIDDSIKYISE